MAKHIIRIRYKRNITPAKVRRMNYRVVDAVSGFFAADTDCAKIDGQYINVKRFLTDFDPRTENPEP